MKLADYDLEAVAAWRAATELLAEVESVDALKAPRAVVHTAYYAMYHAARAVLLRVEGEQAAKKHATVIARFGLLAKRHDSESEVLALLGRALASEFRRRMDADYNVVRPVTTIEAEMSRSRAREFLTKCGRIFEFTPLS